MSSEALAGVTPYIFSGLAPYSSSIAAHPVSADWGHIVFYGGILWFYWGQGSSTYTLRSGGRSILYRTLQGAEILNNEYA